MREILFRAKEADNEYGAWVEGNLAYDDIINVYENYEWVEHYVLPQTVCQYTGLTDKNGKKIFEGDIVKVLLSGNPKPIGVVKYGSTGICGFCVMTEPANSNYVLTGTKDCFEVIGNIYDNPEVLDEVRE